MVKTIETEHFANAFQKVVEIDGEEPTTEWFFYDDQYKVFINETGIVEMLRKVTTLSDNPYWEYVKVDSKEWKAVVLMLKEDF